MDDVIRQHPSKFEVGIFAALLAFLLRIKLVQFYTFRTNAFDLGIYDSFMANLVKHLSLTSSQLNRSLFSEHMSLILATFFPVYAIWPSPIVLLLIQCVAIVAAGYAFYRLCIAYGTTYLNAILLSLIFVSYSYTAAGFMFDFHPEMLIPAFFFSALLSRVKGTPVLFWLFLLLALACKEDVGIYLGSYLAVEGLLRRTLRRDWPAAAVCFWWAFIAIFYLIPWSYPGAEVQSHFVEHRYGHLGSDHKSVIAAMANPFISVPAILNAEVMGLFKRLFYIPLISFPVLLSLVPFLVINGLSSSELQRSFALHYAAPAIPVVFMAYLRATTKLTRWMSRLSRINGETLMAAILLVTLSTMFLKGYKVYYIDGLDNQSREVMDCIGSDGRISAQGVFVTSLRQYDRVFLFPVATSRGHDYRKSRYILVDGERDPWPLSKAELERYISVFDNDVCYELACSLGGTKLFKNSCL